ncbi:MAG: UdgX family uracil-DNA binding protein [Pseudonocardiaceae bacterium]|nr:UdgX family uracil-DNA binding protein [Pseudonocardiaceae bacterium]
MTTKRAGAEQFVPERGGMSRLRTAVQDCQGCGLYRDATQAVFGAGPVPAAVLMVGEQPGDEEDREGEPFVGPAGRLLDRAMDEAKINRDDVYVTNAVKHFKSIPPERGKRRIHRKPSRAEVVACRPWLLAELATVRPELVICLGATAAQSVLGPSFRVSKERGTVREMPGELAKHASEALATVHPSAVLRAPDRREAYQGLLADLRVAASTLSA